MLAARLVRSTVVRRAATASAAAVRPLSASAARLGDHGPAEPFVGPGGKPGSIPTDLEQSTGLRRFEYLSELEGKSAFDMKPLAMTHLGTPTNPIVVESIEEARLVGCTGFPVDSHDTLWLRVEKEKEHGVNRCPECGSCFQLKRVHAPEYHN
ncbi:cytochrome c oxidase [Blastocladiella britannica]|nr:cytochrome c oxidase [Blastocladiella britannica]